MKATLEEAEIKCRDIARKIKAEMPKDWGFLLILTSHGENGHSTYLSSVERSCAIKLLRETADSIEQRKEI